MTPGVTQRSMKLSADGVAIEGAALHGRDRRHVTMPEHVLLRGHRFHGQILLD
jgi:hypothetical protein